MYKTINNFRKRMFAALIAAAVFFCGLGVNIGCKTARAEEDVWDGEVAEWYQDNQPFRTESETEPGSEANPYLIDTAREFALLSELVYLGYEAYNNSGTYYALTGGICLNDTADWEEWGDFVSPANYWTPVGNWYTPFCANLDGKGYKVKGLYICGYYDNQGLFGFVYGGSVCNLGVSESFVSGCERIGAVAGRLYGGSIADCYNTGAIKGESYTGGIAGAVENEGVITDSYNTGAVTGFGYYGCRDIGGIAGYAEDSEISGCYNTGAVSGDACVGGIAGYNFENVITDCYNAGAVEGLDEVGGIIGTLRGGAAVNCYNTGAVSGDACVGGVAGANNYDYGTLLNCYNSGAVAAAYEYAGGILGCVYTVSGSFDGGIFNCYSLITDAVNAGLPLVGNLESLNEYPWINARGFSDGGALSASIEIERNGKPYILKTLLGALNFWAFTANENGGGYFFFKDTGISFAEGVKYEFTLETPKVTITYNTGGGSGVAPAIYELGATLAEPPKPVRLGYDFGGWEIRAGAFSVQFLFTELPPEDLTLFSKWTTSTFLVIFDTAGGSDAPVTQLIDYGGKVGSVPEPAKKGYKFTGWYKGETLWNFGSGTVTANITLVAGWEKIEPAYSALWIIIGIPAAVAALVVFLELRKRKQAKRV